ncbi:DUF6114 domain-containing protein [Parageobacillus toebii]|uniref:DUF6114 domain-containing protein n=1 Tax=Parageobacillus toebii TaxID=153151 RepID=UPI0019685CD7|nr:DUF6114 domain-containing protein [Parageobacillus toebii]QSB49571.1 hypothetical protein JTI59_04660 [Parageobacillus toebii]WMT19690.1 DUF6114 domain-containing protein [Parageobacillus toebii]
MSKEEKVSRFQAWRKSRPFWGAVLTCLSSLIILWIPAHLYHIAFVPGSFAFVGLLFGGLIMILGICALLFPSFSPVLGLMIIFLSVLSIIGALGGGVIGLLIGVIGGSLCFAWRKEPTIEKDDKKDKKEKEVDWIPTSSTRILYGGDDHF